MLLWISGAGALIVCFLFISARLSERQPPAGLQGGKLTSCPDRPNCVCSEYGNSLAGENSAHLQPVDLKKTVADRSPLIVASDIIRGMGGTILVTDEQYMAAVFHSRLFRFVDDFELRWDKEAALLHIRSASRIGHSDFGVNQRRARQFVREYYNAGTSTSVD